MVIKDTLRQILQIIEYLDNKDKFIQEFEELNYKETFLNLLDKLPQEVQKTIKTITDQKRLIEEIHKYITQEQYTTELVKVSNKALSQFLKDIEHTLSEEQKEKIAQLLQKS